MCSCQVQGLIRRWWCVTGLRRAWKGREEGGRSQRDEAENVGLLRRMTLAELLEERGRRLHSMNGQFTVQFLLTAHV